MHAKKTAEKVDITWILYCASIFAVHEETAHIKFKYAIYRLYYLIKDGGYMPRGVVKILKANGETIILEATIGVDYRLSIPHAIRSLIDPYSKVQVTIKKVEEVKT